METKINLLSTAGKPLRWEDCLGSAEHIAYAKKELERYDFPALRGQIISPGYRLGGYIQFEVAYYYDNHRPVVGLKFIGTAA